MQCFGKYLKDPQFVDIAGFAAAIDKLPIAVEASAHHADGEQIDGFKQLVNRENTKETFSIVGKDFKTIQHREALLPVFQKAQEMGLQLRGSVYTRRAFAPDATAGAHMRALVIFEDPQFQFRILKRYDEPFMMAMRISHGLGGGTSLVFRAAGVNMICSNYNMWTEEIAESVRVKHVGNIEVGLARFETAVQRVSEVAATIPGVMQRAFDTTLTPQQAVDALVGVDLPMRTTVKILESLPELLVGVQRQQLSDQGLNAKTLYDATTNFFTHQYTRSPERAEWALQKASNLLTKDLSSVMDRGQERRALLATA